jgi:hypothetical protein
MLSGALYFKIQIWNFKVLKKSEKNVHRGNDAYFKCLISQSEILHIPDYIKKIDKL